MFLSWLQFVQCLCILFLFYLTVLIACMICFYYNVCDCHAFIKGNLLTYLREGSSQAAEASEKSAGQSRSKPRRQRSMEGGMGREYPPPQPTRGLGKAS